MTKRFILALIVATPHLALVAQPAAPKERCLTNNPYEDRYASYSPDGKWIVFESNRAGNWGIFLMDENGRHTQKLTDNSTDNRRPAWYRNGKRVLFESKRNGVQGLYMIHLKSRKVKKLPNRLEKGELIFASPSPKGGKVAVSLKETDDRSNIVLLNKKGAIVRWLTKNERRNFYPRWSNDGSELVYFSRKDTDNYDDEIYRFNLKSGRHTRLTNWPQHNFCPSWSGDGRKIVYVTSMESTRPEIYVMNADGTHKKRMTYNEDGETLPNWHPTENKILVTAYRNGNFEICELELPF